MNNEHKQYLKPVAAAVLCYVIAAIILGLVSAHVSARYFGNYNPKYPGNYNVPFRIESMANTSISIASAIILGLLLFSIGRCFKNVGAIAPANYLLLGAFYVPCSYGYAALLDLIVPAESPFSKTFALFFIVIYPCAIVLIKVLYRASESRLPPKQGAL